MTVHQLERDVGTQLSDAASVLLLSPSMSEHAGGVCAELLLPDADEPQNALWISYTKSPDEQIRRFRSRADGRPRDVGIITVDDAARSAAATAPAGGPTRDGWNETVTSPNDLTGLGIRITEYLKEWSDDPGRTVVCFDSLTALLQYVELRTAYEFLHVLTGRLATIGAFAHFHMDPSAHDDQTVSTVVSLFDAVVEVDEDGDATVRSR